jgi:ribosomal protein L12E/L44/L45/RPP1/RPP2
LVESKGRIIKATHEVSEQQLKNVLNELDIRFEDVSKMMALTAVIMKVNNLNSIALKL